MHPELAALKSLQAIDGEIDERREAISGIPALIEREKQYLTGFESTVGELEKALEAARKKLREAEGEVQSFDQKLRDARGKQTLVKTNEEYRALGAEITGYQEKISALEDAVLEIMDDLPAREERLAGARGELEAARARVRGEVKKHERRLAELERELGELSAESESLAAGVSPEWMRRYRGLRKSRKGLAVCAVVNRACQGCRTAETIKRFLEIRDSEDAIYTCSNCARILYYEEGDSSELSLPGEDGSQPLDGGFARELRRFLERPENVAIMEKSSKEGRPAVYGLGEPLLGRFGDDVRAERIKQMIGEFVRDILVGRGYTQLPNEKIKSGDPLFRSSARYEKPGLPAGAE